MQCRRIFRSIFILVTVMLSIAVLSLQGCAPAGKATLFVAQEDGHVLVSTDGGANWRSRLTRPDTNLWDISAVDEKTVWAAGQGYTADDGVVFRSVDGGNSWSQIYSGKQQYLRGVSAVDSTTAWATGGLYPMDLELRKSVSALVLVNPVIIRTAGGVSNWADKTPKNMFWGEVSRVAAIDADTAWVTAYSKEGTGAWMTDDGGVTWVRRFSRLNVQAEDIAAIDRDNVWVVCHDGSGLYSIVFRTSDGGKTWSSHRFAKDELVRSIAAVNDTTAWAVGSQGLVFKTTDGGKTWVRQKSATKRSLHALSATNPGNACAVGAGGAIIITTDGGKTWRKQFSTNKTDFFGVSMVTAE